MHEVAGGRLGAPEKRLAQASEGTGAPSGQATGFVGHPFLVGPAATQSRSQAEGLGLPGGDSRPGAYKLTPQAVAPGMASLGSMKAARSGIIQAEVMKHESVLTGKIAPEEQKKYKNLRSIYVANLAPQVKIMQLQEYLMRVFTRAGGLIDKVGNAVGEFDQILSVEPHLSTGYVVVEWRSIEECMASLALDGINFVVYYHPRVARASKSSESTKTSFSAKFRALGLSLC